MPSCFVVNKEAGSTLSRDNKTTNPIFSCPVHGSLHCPYFISCSSRDLFIALRVYRTFLLLNQNSLHRKTRGGHFTILTKMASLKDVYDRFIAQPSNDDLVADTTNATLTYITSGTAIRGANEIVQFLARSRKEVQLTETVLATHIATDALTLEIAAECKFKNGGSWIAPGIEANLIDGVVANIALVPSASLTF